MGPRRIWLRRARAPVGLAHFSTRLSCPWGGVKSGSFETEPQPGSHGNHRMISITCGPEKCCSSGRILAAPGAVHTATLASNDEHSLEHEQFRTGFDFMLARAYTICTNFRPQRLCPGVRGGGVRSYGD